MRCGQCGVSLGEGDRFRGDCGAPMAIDEARGIGQQLRCEPLLSRAADMTSPQSHIPVLRAVASNAVAPGAADDR